MSQRLEFAIETIIRAGKSTLAHFRSGTGYEIKNDNTPVTVADRKAEKIVRDAIQKQFPGDTVLGEEEGLSGNSSSRWIVDPIDGTKSFVCGVPLYSNLLSYEEDGVPVLGVAYFPALGELYYAERGEGAFFNGQRCSVSSRTTVDGSFLACGGHRSMMKYGRWKPFESLIEVAMATRTWSDAYGHCMVAAGQIDAMIDPVVSHWDLSAVSVIVQEAGGSFTNFRGGDWREIAHSDGTLEAVSTNFHLQDQILGAFE